MGEHGVLGQPSGLLPNGLLPNNVANVTRVLNMERWSKAERRTAELMAYIQPNQPSEVRRNAVATYVQSLIMKCFSCRVFKFGSVPLKTYLPDGDIDLTACGDNENLKDTWAIAVREVLEKEEKNENAEFRVREVQYIQAEVKLIKCLVENIVVDISFNQVGGLCTLCFLDEVDDLINQNHLFKRSIILIKAWCYYESRVLGAHHGLISTYALEILVLYIFHVFNNSFAGPLEVLYRFLEFFSNFDWDNFCLSLWGPVAISSLPDMLAEPPRKDNGKLFLSEDFLQGCIKKFSVIPVDHENQAQPFVSKHFNVVDPLRTNNNLGRSVSKGNFFRIRSAFAFGAKRLARLLECPMEDITTEVNQFFINTWQRHVSGNRPDVPSLSLQHLQGGNLPIEEKNPKSNTKIKKNIEKVPIHSDHSLQAGHGQDSLFEFSSATRQNPQRSFVTGNMVSHSVDQKYSSGPISSRVSDHSEGNNSSSAYFRSDKSQKINKPVNSLPDEGLDRLHFTRTRSSPELTRATREFSIGRSSRAMEARIIDFTTETAFSNKNRNSASTPLRQSSFFRVQEVNSDKSSASNGSYNFHRDFDFGTVGEELASASETLDMQQEEQDLINMMDSPGIHIVSGQVHVPHVASHIPFALPSMPTPVGFSQQTWSGVYPPSLPLIGSSWGHNLSFSPGLVSSPFSHYYDDATFSTNQNDRIEFINEGSLTAELNSEDSEWKIWQENDAGTSRSCNSDDNNHQMLHIDNKHQKPHYGINPIRTSQTTKSGDLLQRHNRFSKEERGLDREDEIDSFQHQTNTEPDSDPNFGVGTRSFEASHPSSVRTSENESFCDESMEKVPELARDNWERKPVFSSGITSYGRPKDGLQFENSSDYMLRDLDDEAASSSPLPFDGTYNSERVTGSSNSFYGNMRGQLLHPAQITGPDQLVQFAPMLIGSSRQNGVDNPNVQPLPFFAAGPPFPFLMMVHQFCGSKITSQFERQDEIDLNGPSSSEPITESLESIDHGLSSSSIISKQKSSEEHKSDILNSDRSSHWQNLEFGRICQSSHSPGPFPLVRLLQLPAQYPWSGPGSPISANPNLPQIIGYGPRLPMVPLQSGSDRVSGSFQRYGDEASRRRVGTGTYLPTPVSPRERQSSSRSHKWNHHYDRHDPHGDREESWISSKQRASGRFHARKQAERPSIRHDRIAATDNHVDKDWKSYRVEPVSSFTVDNNSFGSVKSSHVSSNVGMASTQSAPVPDARGPVGTRNPLMADPNNGDIADGSSVEPLEFGTLGRLPLLKGHAAPPVSGGIPVSGIHKPRHGPSRVSSQRSSQAQPSSPQPKR